MTELPIEPAILDRVASMRALAEFGIRPLPALRRLHAAHGPFAIVSYPTSRPARPQLMACIADPSLYRTVFSDAETWRPVNVSFRGFGKRSAATRMGRSMTRLRGSQHAHYRRLMTPPLSKSAVFAQAGAMHAIAARHVGDWRSDEALDFAPLGFRLMQDLAISLLFGEDHRYARPAARMIQDAVDSCWPVPGRAHLRWFFTAPKLERLMREWGDSKRGELKPDDVFSVLMNNPDHQGKPTNQALVSSLMVFAYGAAYETCQNALAWTVALLGQHQNIASALVDELRTLDPDTVTGDTLDALPVLDGVVREGMRLFAPVSIQFRRSTCETVLGGMTIPPHTRVLASAFLINRDPEIYAEPDRFMPERWQTLKTSPYEFTVFGAGTRMCPGFVFGIQMVKAALAAIFTRYRVELPANARINHRMTITLAPDPGVPIILRDRARPADVHALAGTVNQFVTFPAAV